MTTNTGKNTIDTSYEQFHKKFSKAAQDLSELIPPGFKYDWLAGFHESLIYINIKSPNEKDLRKVFYYKGFMEGRKFISKDNS